MLIVAFKFNDIFYATATREFSAARYRVLLIFSSRASLEQFPLREKFDSVYFFSINRGRVSQIIAAIRAIIAIKKTRSCTSLILSNPYILLTQLLIFFNGIKCITLLEDGAMNYYAAPQKKWSLQNIRHLILRAMGFYSRITSTYLLNPGSAVRYHGELCKLNLGFANAPMLDELTTNLQNKKILIGGGYLEHLHPALKIIYINYVIKKFGIELYIPHHASKVDDVEIPIFLLEQHSITMEILLSRLDGANIFSFGSTVLISAAALNSNVKTNYLRIVDLANDNKEFDRLMIKSANYSHQILPDGL